MEFKILTGKANEVEEQLHTLGMSNYITIQGISSNKNTIVVIVELQKM
jgi:hypothetical protein